MNYSTWKRNNFPGDRRPDNVLKLGNVCSTMRHKRLPFDVVASDSFYSEANMRHLQRSMKQLEEGQIISKTMEELESMANG